MQKNELVIYCDGGSRGNPGQAASAFIATDSTGVIHKEGKYLGIETNNVAEYTAVLLAITWLAKQLTNKQSLPLHGKKEELIIINLDSQLVERQLNGFYKIKNENLKKLANEIKLLIINSNLLIEFHWGYREKNKLADSLVNDVLDKNTSR